MFILSIHPHNDYDNYNTCNYVHVHIHVSSCYINTQFVYVNHLLFKNIYFCFVNAILYFLLLSYI